MQKENQPLFPILQYCKPSNDWCDICGEIGMPLIEATDKKTQSFMMVCRKCLNNMLALFQKEEPVDEKR